MEEVEEAVLKLQNGRYSSGRGRYSTVDTSTVDMGELENVNEMS